jgi:hypothetical protein
MKHWIAKNYLTLLCQLGLCLGGIYAGAQLLPHFKNFPWIKEFNPTSTTDFVLRTHLKDGNADANPSPSEIIRREVTQLPPDQDILFVGDLQHPSAYILRWMVGYFAFPRRVVNPICNAANEWKHPYDPAKVSAVVFFGNPPKLNIASPPVQILPGLMIQRIGGDERWQSFCLP